MTVLRCATDEARQPFGSGASEDHRHHGSTGPQLHRSTEPQHHSSHNESTHHHSTQPPQPKRTQVQTHTCTQGLKDFGRRDDRRGGAGGRENDGTAALLSRCTRQGARLHVQPSQTRPCDSNVTTMQATSCYWHIHSQRTFSIANSADTRPPLASPPLANTCLCMPQAAIQAGITTPCHFRLLRIPPTHSFPQQ